MSEDGRYCKWVFIGYPEESLPDDYRKILDSYILPWVESPVHAPDDEQIKPHIHFMLDFGKSKKSYKQVMEIVSAVGGSPAVGVERPGSMVRYFVHLDQPEKQQFDISDLVFHGGASLARYNLLDNQDIDDIVDRIFDWCRHNCVTEYSLLCDYVRLNGLNDWKYVLNRRSYMIDIYLRSARHSGYQDLNKIRFDKDGVKIE